MPLYHNVNKMEKPQVSRHGVFDIQVCVPRRWGDKRVVNFANAMVPSGTKNGWTIRKQGSELLGSDNERVKCAERIGFVHITLDA